MPLPRFPSSPPSLALLALLPAPRAAAQDAAAPAAEPAAEPAAGEPMAGDSTAASEIDYPSPDPGIEALKARAAAQQWTRDDLQVPNDFTFSDRREESGITFHHHLPPEGKKHWMPVHYDHGSCVIAGDVDGDGLADLYFVTLVGENGLWRNRGDGTFEDVTAKAGVAVGDRVSMAASFADVDNDGDEDLFVTTIRLGDILFLNDGHGKFTDATAAAGVGHQGHSSTGTFFDYDRDGKLDMLLTNVGRFTTGERRADGSFPGVGDAFQGHLQPDRYEAHVLFHNEGGARFTDASKATGFDDASWAGDSSPVDLDGDLYPEVYLTNMQGDDRYWENQGGTKWVERSAERFPKTPWGTMGIKFFDFDNDGDMDLLLTDMHSDMSQEVGPADEQKKSEMLWSDEQLQGGANNIFGNAFYENLGDGEFEEASDAMGLENYWPWGVSVADLNADGFEDVFITASMSYPFRYGIDSLLLNNRAKKFVDAEFLLGVEPRKGDLHIPWFEIDCDSVNEDGSPRRGADHDNPLCEHRSGHHTVYGTRGTRGSVIFDLDGDGDLDIVTNEFNSRPRILISDLAQKHPIHWLKVHLTGTRSNRDGLGAKVEVKVGDTVYTQVHDGKSGYMAQSALPLYFGLGEATKADRVTVTWPSGEVQTLSEGLAANQQLEITEPAGDGSAKEGMEPSGDSASG